MKQKKWSSAEVTDIYMSPFFTLLDKAHLIHTEQFNSEEIELCTLLSIKTGTCPEDCAYCPQSAHYKTDIEKESLLKIDDVLKKANLAKKNGSTRFCMGAAWRNPPTKEFRKVLEIIQEVKALGLETCATLGMLTKEQAVELQKAGLDFYNHNLDTSPEYYKQIISTRTFQERLDTIKQVRNAGMNVCCGGIIGMGETREDRIALLVELVNLPKPPESVPINRLMPAKGTPLSNCPQIDNFEFIRTIAVARIIMPTSVVRLTAGRESMSEEMQALCFFAGANSIFCCDRLLTMAHANVDQDLLMLTKLGLKPKRREVC